MLRKLIILQVLVLAGLGSILLLPRTYGMRESALITSLPNAVGSWTGHSQEIPDKVKGELAKDTRFNQKYYLRPTPGQPEKFDRARAFVVFSGDDMNNSIHRPERCFRAQGLTIVESSTVEIDVGYNKKLQARRLVSESAGGFRNVTYYWFTGADKLTASHYQRTITDMMDRLATGTNQSWAYITIAADYGFDQSVAPLLDAKDEGETDAMLQGLIGELFEQTHKVDQLDGWEKSEP